MPEPGFPQVTVVSKSKRVRCSSIHLARLCDRFPWLSVRHPASHDASRFGTAVDKQVSLVLSCIAAGNTADLPSDEELLPETSIILDWVEKNYPLEVWEWHVQHHVQLVDPESGEILTEGTPDLLFLHRTEPRFEDVDMKSEGQMFAGYLQKPDENDQQLSYVTAYWLEVSKTRKIESAKIILACWGLRGVKPLESQPITEQRLSEVIETIRAIPPVDPDAPQPEASVGSHCLHCWQRGHCDEHLLPLAVVTKAGLPVPYAEFVGGDLTAETTVKALTWLEGAKRILSEAKKIVDLVEGNADAFVTQNGAVTVGELMYGPQEVKGRKAGATVATLTKEGLTRLIREGETKVKCKFYPAPKP